MIDIAGALLELHNAQSDNRHDDAAGTVLGESAAAPARPRVPG